MFLKPDNWHPSLLIDAHVVDDGLQSLVHFIDIFECNAGDFKALAVGDIDNSLSIFRGNFNDFRKGFRIDFPAGHRTREAVSPRTLETR